MKRKTKLKDEEMNLDIPPFHEMFPITLLHNDRGIEKVCYFMCKEHLQTYITRNKLKKNQVNIQKTGERNNGSK
jgi:hypothetical protein